MLFMTIYKFKPEHRNATVNRFLETGGPPPDGVKMLGRWHASTMNGGYTLADADSPEAIARWCHQWADLLSFEVVPVMEDEAVVRVLKS